MLRITIHREDCITSAYLQSEVVPGYVRVDSNPDARLQGHRPRLAHSSGPIPECGIAVCASLSCALAHEPRQAIQRITTDRGHASSGTRQFTNYYLCDRSGIKAYSKKSSIGWPDLLIFIWSRAPSQELTRNRAICSGSIVWLTSSIA